MAKLRPLLIVCLMAAGCADRLAGTSTTAENTITGVAMLPGGKPASGAVVSARSGTVVLARNGEPVSRLLGLAYADSLGNFQVKLPRAQPFFLEIRSAPVFPQGPIVTLEAVPVSWFGAFPDSSSKSRALGALQLGPSGTLTGLIKELGDSLEGRVWIGVEGTDNFRLLDPPKDTAGAPFTLKEVPSGPHTLRVWVEGPHIDAIDLPVPTDSVKAVTADPGAVRDVGTVYVGKP